MASPSASWSLQSGKKRSKTGHLEKFSSKRVIKGFKPSWEKYFFQLVGDAYLQYFHKGTVRTCLELGWLTAWVWLVCLHALSGIGYEPPS